MAVEDRKPAPGHRTAEQKAEAAHEKYVAGLRRELVGTRAKLDPEVRAQVAAELKRVGAGDGVERAARKRKGDEG